MGIKYLQIEYVDGDATEPIGGGAKIIAHVVNDLGLWGKGFVLSLSNKWPNTKAVYKAWYSGARGEPQFWPGTVRICNAGKTEDIYVAHMLCQSGVKRRNQSSTVLQYDMLRNCLGILSEMSITLNASVHMPLIGAGLAGGDWKIIRDIIHDELIGNGVAVTVYALDDNGRRTIDEANS